MVEQKRGINRILFFSVKQGREGQKRNEGRKTKPKKSIWADEELPIAN